MYMARVVQEAGVQLQALSNKSCKAKNDVVRDTRTFAGMPDMLDATNEVLRPTVEALARDMLETYNLLDDLVTWLDENGFLPESDSDNDGAQGSLVDEDSEIDEHDDDGSSDEGAVAALIRDGRRA